MHPFTWLRSPSSLAKSSHASSRRAARRDQRLRFFVPLRLEVLEPRTLLAVDFGDAPAPYPTLLTENGAEHEATGPMLGASRNTEADGTHSATANAHADDDGVTFGVLQVGALGASVTVNVQGGASKLDAWIDFNADGVWGGPGEEIAFGRSVAEGNNNLTFDVPSWAKEGTTFARFRLETGGRRPPEGAAEDGEVEDYAVSILPPTATAGDFGAPNEISTNAEGAAAVFAADMDRDGDLDVLSASSNDDKIAWHENDGDLGFTEHVISTAADSAASVFAVDVDEDGDLDVLSASSFDDKIAWYENDGSQTFTARTISTTANSARSVYAADINGDGTIDVLSASSIDDKIAWYQRLGNSVVTFAERTISLAANGADSVFAADVDGDGDMDVLSASEFDDKIAWYDNDGDQNFTTRPITMTANGARSVFAADVDGDGDMDVLSASSNDDKIAWYENDGTPFNGGWTNRTISTAADGACSVFAGDMDGDGDVDVLSASEFDGKIVWYTNDGNQSFTAQTISAAAMSANAVMAADVDGDGDLDVLSASVGDDKIAWYENALVDFGDAPAPYATLLAESGAKQLATGPTLGPTRDTEADGMHSAAANADGSDEDGATFGMLRAGALDAAVTVNVQGGAAKLDAWIDFNGDGTWGGPGEQVLASASVVVGDNLLTFDVPSWAKDGETFARFRLSTEGGLGPEGTATDGEVEDYAVTILPPASAEGVFGPLKGITSAVIGPLSIFAADVDSDGDMDVLSASYFDNRIAWYENNGSQNFTIHTISSDAAVAYSVFAADVDGDGDQDVLSASQDDDKIAWYENDGSQSFTARNISTAADGAHSVFAADVDGDGDQDVLSASQGDDKIAWYENDGSQNFTPRAISTNADRATSVFAADVDGDGDLDVLSASQNDDKIAWYENDGSQNFTERLISTAADIATSVFAADVDGDGDMDALSASQNDDTIAWYENNGSQSFTLRTISTTADSAQSVFAADVDGDGDLDVLAASAADDRVAWYENDGSQTFTLRTISTATDLPYSVFAADVDSDGDLDVLSASHSDNPIAWYQQNAFPVLAVNAGVTVSEGSGTVIKNTRLKVSDDNAPAELAYSVTAVPSHGQLELSTVPGVAITSFTQATINSSQLRYRHDGSETTSDSFTFTVSDGNGGSLPATVFNITINPLNDAPVLNIALSPTLRPTSEDAVTPASTLLSSLLTGAVTDPDPGAQQGIAVTTASDFNGTWEFSLNAGASWQAMGAPTSSAARLLPADANTRLRYRPKPDFNGTVQLFYRAWDGTQGAAGGTLNTSGNTGGSKSLSTDSESAALTITPVNDAPDLALSGTNNYVHDAAAIVLAPNAGVTDVDSDDFENGRLRVRITDGANASNRLAIGAGFTVDANNNVLQGSIIIGKRTANGFATNELIITFNANATRFIVQQLVRAVTFKTIGGVGGVRKVVFTVSDGDGELSAEATKLVNVT